MTPPPLQRTDFRDQYLMLVVMLLVLLVCVGVVRVVTVLVDSDTSCEDCTMLGGEPYLCVDRGDSVHCYPKECE